MDCPIYPSLEYGKFSEWLHLKANGQRIPLNGIIELTQRCNLRCAHCYIPPTDRAAKYPDELTTSEVKRIIDETAAAGCFWMLFTGGEPLLRGDFKEIYLYARRAGLLVTLFTNGTLITPEIADFLAEWRPFSIEITLYGRSQTIYERVTGRRRSHADCYRGIDLLIERGLPLKLKTMAMSLNQAELGAMEAYAQSIGVEYRFDPIINAALDGSLRPTKVRLSPEEVVRIEQADSKRTEHWPAVYDIYKKRLDGDNRLFTCGAGQQSFHISSQGLLTACSMLRTSGYNIREGNFETGWREFIPASLTGTKPPDSACLNCDLQPVCAQCPAIAQLELGQPDKPVNFVCEVAHLRKSNFGL